MSQRDDLKLLCENAVGFSDVSLAPDVVLGLLAELDVSNNVGRALTETLESVCESRDALARANKQLKAENETLTKIFNDAPNLPDTDVEWLEKTRLLEAQNDQLKAENEALRKARKPFNDKVVGYSDGCIVCGQWGGHFGLPCPRTQAQATFTGRDGFRP